MTFEVESVLGSLAMGLAAALVAYASRDYVAAALDAVERDLAEKLRRLRASTRRLRAYLIAWLAAIVVLFACFWLLLSNLTFAVLISLFLAAAPWYLLRRMAERRQLKIEDQLADAMVTLANAVRAGL
ncbi:MAG: hypothetical protein HQ582_17220, partial [Planctomycetes bacterium]|nr:hypothetical protein [Planctomycetota bacterium]